MFFDTPLHISHGLMQVAGTHVAVRHKERIPEASPILIVPKAHLALRTPVQSLAILPIAISAIEETVHPMAPLKLLILFDPSEPLFDKPGWHPAVSYRKVNVSISHPNGVTSAYREQY